MSSWGACLRELARQHSEVPGQQLLNAVDRIIGDVGVPLAHVSFTVQAIEFCCSDQNVKRRGISSSMAYSAAIYQFLSALPNPLRGDFVHIP